MGRDRESQKQRHMERLSEIHTKWGGGERQRGTDRQMMEGHDKRETERERETEGGREREGHTHTAEREILREQM